jgi:hypothetical protein
MDSASGGGGGGGDEGGKGHAVSPETVLLVDAGEGEAGASVAVSTAELMGQDGAASPSFSKPSKS